MGWAHCQSRHTGPFPSQPAATASAPSRCQCSGGNHQKEVLWRGSCNRYQSSSQCIWNRGRTGGGHCEFHPGTTLDILWSSHCKSGQRPFYNPPWQNSSCVVQSTSKLWRLWLSSLVLYEPAEESTALEQLSVGEGLLEIKKPPTTLC